MRLDLLVHSFLGNGCKIAKLDYPENEIKAIKFFSPLESEWKTDTLYVAGEGSFYTEAKVPDHKVSIFFFGAYHGEFEWAGNLIILKDIKEDRNVLYELQKIFSQDTEQMTEQIEVMTEAVIDNQGLQFFLDKASEVVGNPLIILDNNLKPKAVSIGQFVYSWRVQGLGTSEIQNRQANIIQNLEGIVSGFDRITSETKSIHDLKTKFLYSDQLRCNCMIRRISSSDLDMAILVMLEIRTNILDIRINVISVLTGFISQELQKVSWFMDNKGDMKAGFLVELLNDKYPNRRMIDRRLDVLNYPLKGEMYMVVVQFSRHHMKNANLLLFQFQRILTGELYTIYQNELVILMNREKGQGIGAYTVETMREVANRCHLRIGISREFYDLAEVRRYYEQARKALNYGEIYFNKNHQHPLYYFHDYVLIEMLEICRRNENLIDFCNPKLLRLLHYDKEQGTDYMSTLYQFLEHSCNVKKTADALFIHKNTLIYRLDKIRAITESTLSDSWENFTLYLSYRIVMFTGIFSPPWMTEEVEKFWEELKK